jgi:hypothetical protein
VLDVPLREQRTVLEYPEAKGSQGQGWQRRVKGSYEVFVKPLRFFHLKTDPLDGLQLLRWEVDDEPDTQIIEPFNAPSQQQLLVPKQPTGGIGDLPGHCRLTILQLHL